MYHYQAHILSCTPDPSTGLNTNALTVQHCLYHTLVEIRMPIGRVGATAKVPRRPAEQDAENLMRCHWLRNVRRLKLCSIRSISEVSLSGWWYAITLFGRPLRKMTRMRQQYCMTKLPCDWAAVFVLQVFLPIQRMELGLLRFHQFLPVHSPLLSHKALAMAPIAIEKNSVSESEPVATKALQIHEQTPSYSRPDGKKLPVTLLSGFLGSGKTTLLERILTSNHGYRVGVIVNDMGALNIDAALLANHRVQQSQERVVEMQNGCICCTLRGDLLEEVAQLAMGGTVDYLLIESSGISEPMQVAETFSEEFAEMHKVAGQDLQVEMASDASSAEKNAKVAEILSAGGLSTMSRLDCCVTMIDAVNFFNDYETADFLVDRHKDQEVPEEDDRNVSDLQTDQIEFANVIIINKCDLVKQKDVDRIQALVKTLNPNARILTSVKANIDVSQLLDTKLFSYEEAAMGAGWLQSLREEIKPETEEYGIGSFVYRARRPFHPARLWETIKKVFVVIQEEYIDDGEEEKDEMEQDDDSDESTSDDGMDLDERQPQLNPAARLAAKKADKTFAQLLRSKGFLWLATRPQMFGEWSQAGVMLTLKGGDQWRCELPESEWPDSEEIRKAIRADFEGPWGDRRQELVFIGLDMRAGGQEAITEKMNDCLLNNDEWAQWQTIMRNKKLADEDKKVALEQIFEDGFEDWMLENHEGHDHDH